MNGFYILLLILLKTFLVPLPNDLIRLGVPGTINSVLSMAEFSAAFELFTDYKIFYRGYFISTQRRQINVTILLNPSLLRSRSGSVETFFTLLIIFVMVDFSFM